MIGSLAGLFIAAEGFVHWLVWMPAQKAVRRKIVPAIGCEAANRMRL